MVPHSIQQQAHISPGPPLVTYVHIETLLATFDIPGKMQLLLAFSFPYHIPGWLDNVSIFLPHYLSLLSPFLCFLLMPECLPGVSCWFIKPSWHFSLTSCFWDELLLNLRGGDLSILTMFSFLDPPSLQSLIPWDSSKQIHEVANTALLKSSTVTLLFALLPYLRIL